jgi:hypothetical protein
VPFIFTQRPNNDHHSAAEISGGNIPFFLRPVAWQYDMASLEYLTRIGKIQAAFPQRDFPLHRIEADFHDIKGITFNLPRQGRGDTSAWRRRAVFDT